jgi:hypothetical protein
MGVPKALGAIGEAIIKPTKLTGRTSIEGVARQGARQVSRQITKENVQKPMEKEQQVEHFIRLQKDPAYRKRFIK